MKSLITSLMLGIIATAGCVTLPEVDSKTTAINNAEKTRGLPNDKVPVMADQINSENASKILKNLEDEVTRAFQEPLEIAPENN